MNFLPDVYVPCETCQGKRYNREPSKCITKVRLFLMCLKCRWRKLQNFFAAFTPIARHLNTLVDVGLGYIRLGQPATTLSGGEAQRVNLPQSCRSVLTVVRSMCLMSLQQGLHFEDIRKLLTVLQSLVDKGNTVITLNTTLMSLNVPTGLLIWVRKAAMVEAP